MDAASSLRRHHDYGDGKPVPYVRVGFYFLRHNVSLKCYVSYGSSIKFYSQHIPEIRVFPLNLRLFELSQHTLVKEVNVAERFTVTEDNLQKYISSMHKCCILSREIRFLNLLIQDATSVSKLGDLLRICAVLQESSSGEYSAVPDVPVLPDFQSRFGTTSAGFHCCSLCGLQDRQLLFSKLSPQLH